MKEYRLFLGTLPNVKTSWKSEMTTQREAYYVSITAIPDIRVEIMLVSRNWHDNYWGRFLFLNPQILSFWTIRCVLRTNNYTACLKTFTRCSKMNQNRLVNAH